MCSKLILYFTQLYFLPLIIAGVARARPAVMSPAFIGCQCSEWAVFVASNQSDRSNSVPRALFSSLVFIYAALQTPSGSCNVRWNLHGRLSGFASRYSFNYDFFFLIPLYVLDIRSSLTRRNSSKRRWTRINMVVLVHFENEISFFAALFWSLKFLEYYELLYR